MEIQSFFYGYNDCFSVDPSFLTNQGMVLNQNEIVNVRQCTTVVVPNPAGGTVRMMRGTNRNVMANACSPGNPRAWTYQDLDVAPLSFPYPLVAGNVPGNFLVTMSDGNTANPVCVQSFPADEENEMKTFVIIGEEWGDGKGYTKNPVKIEIVGDVFFNVNGKLVNGRGLTFTEDDDPFEYMKYTSRIRLNEAKVVEFHTRGEGAQAQNDCRTAGFTTTTNVVKLRFTGGGTLNGIIELASNQKSAFVLRDASGNSMNTGYLGIAGMNNDGDNNFDLCLDDTFDVNTLDNVLVSCSGNDILVPPKGPDFPCRAHSMKVDKSRASKDYIDACKCDFDHFYDAVCDPNGRLPPGHPAFGRNYCKVFAPTSTCPDIFVDAQGNSMSYQACNYRSLDWNDEMTECNGLTPDVRAPTAEICKVNCEEDDSCAVYQFTSTGCARGTSNDCSGHRAVIAGERKAAYAGYPGWGDLGYYSQWTHPCDVASYVASLPSGWGYYSDPGVGGGFCRSIAPSNFNIIKNSFGTGVWTNSATGVTYFPQVLQQSTQSTPSSPSPAHYEELFGWGSLAYYSAQTSPCDVTSFVENLPSGYGYYSDPGVHGGWCRSIPPGNVATIRASYGTGVWTHHGTGVTYLPTPGSGSGRRLLNMRKQ